MGKNNAFVTESSHPNGHGNAGPSTAGDRDAEADIIAPHIEPYIENEDARSIRETPEAGSGKLPKWAAAVGQKIPHPVKRVTGAIGRWCAGPKPPRIWKITPFLPRVQTAPLRLIDRIAPKKMHRFWLLMVYYFLFLLCFVTILHESAFSDEIPGYGSPTRIACTAEYWSDKNSCGLDGEDCRPFDNTTMPFRCPGNCLATHQLNPHAVGTQSVIYRPLVVGGPTDPANSVETAYYRGDSFVCGAAIHAGFITNNAGGCGVVQLTGEQSNYPAVDANGISSVGFDSNFPLSFSFVPGTLGNCKDLRWPLLAVSVGFTTILSLFTNSAPVFFWSTFGSLFFHTALVSDPPTASNYYDLVSSALGRFLPAAFCMAVIYLFCVRRQLTGLQAQVEKTVLWLGACWVGALNNYTFDKIPIQRLTPHDLHQQPGAIPALIIIVLVIFSIAVGQAYAIRVEGLFWRYLALYCFMGFCILMLVAVPKMNVRIHHYILALLLLPGTAMQNRPSLLYQGLLVGLFINGIARWGFDSILQTPADLLQDGQLGSALPVIDVPKIENNTIQFTWADLPPDEGYDGVSILVNDVERYRGYIYDGPMNFTWTRDAPEGDPEYFRFGYMGGSSAADFTKAGVWAANGDWTPMEAGPSK
ncbi:hypothetical protein FH972_024649 [Carpinus fangiana]|uniref:LCCL domain-containing protein n=1 Tax=Carpinus fangiana TaxID=176857 RepID=A0A5N6KZI1_9ROSI|nr:hypothetical protein FH972_024649 [Carpinus fangiana]